MQFLLSFTILNAFLFIIIAVCEGNNIHNSSPSPSSSMDGRSLSGATSSSTIPEYFNLGVMFSIAMNNQPSPDLIFLSAILMAIDHINNKSDGIYDRILPNTQLKTIFRPCENKFFLGATNAHSLIEVDPLHHVMANIGPFGSNTLRGAVPTFQEANRIPVLGFRDRSAILGYSRFYPNFLRTIPGVYQDGYAIATLISQYFSWEKVTIFSCMTDSSRGSLTTFAHYASLFGIQILSSHVFENSRVDMTDAIVSAKQAGSKIFILFLDPTRAKLIIEHGQALKLFTSETQVIGGEDLVASSSIWNSMNLSSTTLDSLFTGVIGVKFHRLSPPSSELKELFLQEWRQHEPTNGYIDPSTGRAVCNTRMDSYNSSYLHQFYPNNNMSSEPKCAGVNFSSYSTSVDLENELIEVMYAYDASLSVAVGLHHLLYTQNNLNPTPDDLHETLLHDVRFTGLTGEVSFSTELQNDEFDVGGRFTGILYDIVNYIPPSSSSSISSSSELLKEVLQWHSESGFTLCDGLPYYVPNNPCHSFVFQTSDGTVPSDSPQSEIEDLSSSSRSVLQILSSLGIVASFFVFIIIYSYYSQRLVKISQPLLANFKKFGIFLGFIRVLLASFDLTPTQCTVQLWLEHLSFQLIFTTISVRCWRVFLVTASMKRVKITDRQCLKLIVLGLTVILILLSIFTILNEGTIHYATVTKNQFEYIQQPVCHYPSETLMIIMYTYDLLILSTGLYYCWLIRKVGTAVSNTPALVEGFLTTTVSIIGASILLGLVDFDPIDREFMKSLIICLLLLRILWVFENQIIYRLLAGYDLDRTLTLRKSQKNIFELLGFNFCNSAAKISTTGGGGSGPGNEPNSSQPTSSVSGNNSEILTLPGSSYLLKIDKYSKLQTRDEIIFQIDRVKEEFQNKQIELTSLENMLFTFDQEEEEEKRKSEQETDHPLPPPDSSHSHSNKSIIPSPFSFSSTSTRGTGGGGGGFLSGLVGVKQNNSNSSPISLSSRPQVHNTNNNNHNNNNNNANVILVQSNQPATAVTVATPVAPIITASTVPATHPPQNNYDCEQQQLQPGVNETNADENISHTVVREFVTGSGEAILAL